MTAPFILFQQPAVDNIVIAMAAFTCALLVHAEGQGYVYALLGYLDRKKEKRVFSFNPLAHLDIWGLIAFVLGGFGWSRQVDPACKINKPSHLVMVYLAGPAANLLFANIISSILYMLKQMANYLADEKALNILLITNISFAVYNLLIPVPPLAAGKLIARLKPVGINPRYIYGAGVLAILALLCIEHQSGRHFISSKINSLVIYGYQFLAP